MWHISYVLQKHSGFLTVFGVGHCVKMLIYNINDEKFKFQTLKPGAIMAKSSPKSDRNWVLGSADFWCILFSYFQWEYQMMKGNPAVLKSFSETTFLWTNKCHTHICSFIICCSHVLWPESLHPSSFSIYQFVSFCFVLHMKSSS